MRVCIVHEYFKPYVTGGADIFINAFADYLIKKGIEIDIITTLQANLKKNETIDGINIHRFESSPFRKKHRYQYTGLTIPWNYFNISLIKKMKKIMEKSNVILLNNIFHLSFSTLIAAKLSNKPVILDVHDYWPLCFKKDLLYKDREICSGIESVKCGGCLLEIKFQRLRFLLPFYIPLVWIDDKLRNFFMKSSFDMIVVHSNFVKKKINNKIKKPIKVILYPFYGKIHRMKKFLKGTTKIMYIGRLNFEKGVHLIPEICQQLKRKGIDFKFDIIGKGPYFEPLKKKMKGLENVKIHGGIYDEKMKTKLFLDSDIMIIPSIWEEPFGIVTLEAMAHGLPVISSNKGGLGEIVIENEVGLTCEPTTKKISETIEKMISDKKNYIRFSLNGYKNIEKYDKMTIFKKYEKLLKTVC